MILFIYGKGGAGIELYDLVYRNKSIRERYDKVYFIDDFEEEHEFYGTMTIPFSLCEKYIVDSPEFIISVGEPAARAMLLNRITGKGYNMAKVVDETAIISETSKIENGCIIGPGAFISSEVQIKENCFVMLGAIIGHHAVVEGSCVICPQATVGGHSIVGARTFLGIGSSMMQNVNIGEDAIVAMGAKVFRNVDSFQTVIGNPARATKGNGEHKVF